MDKTGKTDRDNASGLKARIRAVPDWPKKGIMFRDITTLLKDPSAFRHSIEAMAGHYKGRRIDVIASAESRGFIFGSTLAYELGAGFVPIRKPGKLPHHTERQEYELEYGKDALEIHSDAIKPGQNVLLVDDLLATGGTIKAAAELVSRLGGTVIGFCFLIELAYLNGRSRLLKQGSGASAGAGPDIFSLITYDEE